MFNFKTHARFNGLCFKDKLPIKDEKLEPRSRDTL